MLDSPVFQTHGWAATGCFAVKDNPSANKQGTALVRLWPVAALLLVLVLLFLFGPDNETLFEALRTHREKLLSLVADHAVIAELVFAVIYAAAIALSIPGGAMMTLIGKKKNSCLSFRIIGVGRIRCGGSLRRWLTGVPFLSWHRCTASRR